MATIKSLKKLTLINVCAAILIATLFIVNIIFAITAFNAVDNKKSRQYFSLVQMSLSINQNPSVSGVDYAVISLGGEVQLSTIKDYPLNSFVEFKTLAGLDGTIKKGRVYFAAPYYTGNQQSGTIILLIDKQLVVKSAVSSIFWLSATGILAFCAVILLLYINRHIKKDIATPLHLLNKIAKRMAGGDYNEKIIYDFHDEMGGLCHDLESLRDQLAAAQSREKEFRKNEKFLLACISHDLKTPLAVILGAAESIKDNLISPDAAADKIIDKSEKLKKLIDDILEQTKTEIGEFSIAKTECYAKSYFEKEIDGFWSEAESKSIKLTAGICPDCLINIDKQRIYQVLQNLVGNALKYTKPGGNIKINYFIENHFLIISIEDSGEGIPACDLPFIFDKFYRGEKARMDVSGSGLGLSIAKYIIEKHDGSIECDTLLKKGTTMSFSLPLV